MDNTTEMFGGRVKTDAVELAYVVKSSGEPVVLIHGGVFADAFYPLLKEPALNKHYRLISYHRRGYGRSTHQEGTSNVKREAADCLALIRELGIESAHVVGISYGGLIALQLTFDAPDKVNSLSLLEPALVNLGPANPELEKNVAQLVSLYQSGNKAKAIDAFQRFVLGEDEQYRAAYDKVMPDGYWDQVVRDADTLFRGDFPAVMSFQFTEQVAKRVKQPVLFMRGSNGLPGGLEIQQVIQSWLPQTETFLLPNATHGMQMRNPLGAAEALSRFFAKHPLKPMKQAISRGS